MLQPETSKKRKKENTAGDDQEEKEGRFKKADANWDAADRHAKTCKPEPGSRLKFSADTKTLSFLEAQHVWRSNRFESRDEPAASVRGAAESLMLYFDKVEKIEVMSIEHKAKGVWIVCLCLWWCLLSQVLCVCVGV